MNHEYRLGNNDIQILKVVYQNIKSPYLWKLILQHFLKKSTLCDARAPMRLAIDPISVVAIIIF